MKIISLEDRGWFTVEELAKKEGVSTRTIYNRLKRGDVEKRDTDQGARYRLLKATESPFHESFTEGHESPTEKHALALYAKGEATTESPFHEGFTEVHEGFTERATESPSAARLAEALATLTTTNAELVHEASRLRALITEQDEEHKRLQARLDAYQADELERAKIKTEARAFSSRFVDALKKAEERP
jgi:hypothetical protein